MSYMQRMQQASLENWCRYIAQEEHRRTGISEGVLSLYLQIVMQALLDAGCDPAGITVAKAKEAVDELLKRIEAYPVERAVNSTSQTV